MKLKSGLILFLTGYSLSLSAAEVDATLGWAEHQRYGFAVTGVVDEVNANVGQKVDKGQQLARLDRRPFNYHVKQCQAEIRGLDPKIYDARIALNQAEELFERTVLSEVELQRIDGAYKTLVAESDVLKAKCHLEKWRAEKASLKAGQAAYVYHSNIFSGQIISEENQDEIYIELVSASRASATAKLSAEQKTQLNSSGRVTVKIDSRSIPAKLSRLDLIPDKERQYRAVVEFDYSQPVEAGKTVRISF